MQELIKEVERRAAEDNKRQQGADYRQIVREVAAEHGVEDEALRQACLDAWIAEGAGG
jgi:hypothetical protein